MDVTVDDFLAGLLATLAERRVAAVSIRGEAFYRAVQDSFKELEALSENLNLDVRFYITLDPVYSDSPVVREAITTAVQRDLISLDNPEYQDMRLKITRDEAIGVLESLPGGPDVYRKVTDAFLANYPFVAI